MKTRTELLEVPKNLNQSPEKYYQFLHLLWQLNMGCGDPDHRHLLNLHRALCEQERKLCQVHPERCLRNLQQRLQDGRNLGLDLPLPLWAAHRIEELFALAEDNSASAEEPA